jgi:hypothetical protein
MAMKLNHLPALYFLHIPKTAGTSFRFWLMRLFKVEDTLDIHHLPELENVKDETLKQHQFFSGHFGWRMMERAKTIGKKCDALTVLRDPSDVYKSWLKYMPDLPNDALLAMGDAKYSMQAVINCLSFTPLHFEATRRLGYLDPNIDFSIHTSSYLGNPIVRYVALHGTQVPIPQLLKIADLELAKDRLNTMLFFGMMDDWQGTTILFAFAYCLPLRTMETRHNVTKQTELTFDVEKLQALWKVHNSFDFELYNFAMALFSERLAQAQKSLGVAPNATYESYAEPLLNRFLHTDQGIPRIYNASIPICADFIQTGFEHRFPDGDGWAIWADKLKSSIYLPLANNKNLEIRLIVGTALSLAIRDRMRISVAGVLCEHVLGFFELEPQSDIWHTHFTINCPEGLILDQQYTQIEFEIPELIAVDFGALKTQLGFSLIGDILITEVVMDAI